LLVPKSSLGVEKQWALLPWIVDLIRGLMQRKQQVGEC